MVFDKLQQFYKTKRPTKGSPYGTTNDPYAIIRSILNDINPSWEGDRGPDKTAPPWGVGPYAKSPQGIGAIATDSVISEAIKILEDDNFSGKAIDRVSRLLRDKYVKEEDSDRGQQKMLLSKNVN